MSEASSNSANASAFGSQSATEPARLPGLGRGTPRPTTNEPPPPAPPPPATTSWNSNRSGGFTSENSFQRNSSGFGGNSRPRDYGSGNDGYQSNDRRPPPTCYNCQQSGHMSRDCPEPRTGGRNYNNSGFDSRSNNREGFSSGGGSGGGHSGFSSRGGFGSRSDSLQAGFSDSRSTQLSSPSNDNSSFRSGASSNFRNRNDFDGSKQGFGGGQSNSEDTGRGNEGFGGFQRTTTFHNSTGRSGFSSGGTFRGGASGGGGGGDRNCYNCGQPGHIARACTQERTTRENGGSSGGFRSSGSRSDDWPSGDNPDRSDNRANGAPKEQYVPPPPPTSEADIFGETTTKGKNFEKYHRTHVQCTPEGRLEPIELYEEANLGVQILSNIRRAQFDDPTAIQRYTIPCLRQELDLMACAQTGSGKTAAFLLPIIANLLEFHADELAERPSPPAPLCLILSPTRELALQTTHVATKFAFDTAVKTGSAVGGIDGASVDHQLRQGCHILSATTGRLMDMAQNGRISLKKVRYFVLDEADRMLDEGFAPDIQRLGNLGLTPKADRVTSMFSATFPKVVQELARDFLRDDYIFLAVGKIGGANEDILQSIEEVRASDKKGRLIELLDQNLKDERCLIFVEQKRTADYIGSLLSQKNRPSTTMHGDRNQRQRMEAVKQFTNGGCPILVATSVAARGLDFPLIGYVVNYDLPDSSDFYIHRIGRTGRAGHLGKSISFFDPDRESDRRIAPDLAEKLSETGQEVPQFLRQYTPESSNGFNRPGRNTDIRSNTGTFGSRSQTASASGGGWQAGGAAEQWSN